MRATTIATSAALHGGVLATLALWPVRPPAPRSPSVPTPPAPRVLLIDVVRPQTSTSSAPRGVSPRHPAPRFAAARELQPLATTTSGPVPEVVAVALARAPLNLALPAAVAERIVAGDRPAKEHPDEESRWAYDPRFKLRAAGHGEHRIADPAALVHVARDGAISLVDQPSVTSPIELPTPRKFRGDVEHARDELAAWIEDPYRDARVGRTQDLPNHLMAVPGMCDSMCFTAEDQRREWAREDASLAAGTGIPAGRLDLTGLLSKRLGAGDPYASRKLKIIDQTRAERIAIGRAHRGDQDRRSAELALRNLEALWRATASAAERRAALFELWDECDETEAGERARAIVLGWIRARLPAGSPAAFTAEEIAALDRRRSSRQPFVPYAP